MKKFFFCVCVTNIWCRYGHTLKIRRAIIFLEWANNHALENAKSKHGISLISSYIVICNTKAGLELLFLVY